MGGVFFRRRLRPRVEVVNDYSRDVSNFFRVLQRHPTALLEEMLAWQIQARAEFERLTASDPDTLTDLERAARFYVLQRCAYAGKVKGRSFGIPTNSTRLNIRTQRRQLERIHNRMAGVVIECLSFDEFIPRYDRVDALFYLDPPYFAGENDYGKDLFKRSDFQCLAAILAKLQGRFILSLNDVPQVRAIFADFALESVEAKYTIGDSDPGQARPELLITDGTRPGDLTSMQLDLV